MMQNISLGCTCVHDTYCITKLFCVKKNTKPIYDFVGNLCMLKDVSLFGMIKKNYVYH